MTIVCFNIFPMVKRSNIRFYRDGNFFLAMHELHQYIIRSFFSEENQLDVCRHRSDLEITPCLIEFIGIRFGFPHIAQLKQRYIIRKTKCFDFWERNVLFPKTKRSFFRTPTLPFSA